MFSSVKEHSHKTVLNVENYAFVQDFQHDLNKRHDISMNKVIGAKETEFI